MSDQMVSTFYDEAILFSNIVMYATLLIGTAS